MRRFYKYIFAFIFFGLLFKGYTQTKNCMDNLSSEEFKTKIDSFNNEIIIDVRHVDLKRDIIIENALYFPTRNDLIKFVDTLDRDIPILVYCITGDRSIAACNLLCEKGFNHVANLKNGIETWERKGYKVISIKNL